MANERMDCEWSGWDWGNGPVVRCHFILFWHPMRFVIGLVTSRRGAEEESSGETLWAASNPNSKLVAIYGSEQFSALPSSPVKSVPSLRIWCAPHLNRRFPSKVGHGLYLPTDTNKQQPRRCTEERMLRISRYNARWYSTHHPANMPDRLIELILEDFRRYTAADFQFDVQFEYKKFHHKKKLRVGMVTVRTESIFNIMLFTILWTNPLCRR
jgi:hypothetical protein